MSFRRSSAVIATAVILTSALATSCHRPEVATPAPLALHEEYCWWAVFRTTLPPDSVAVHFVRAFQSVGLTDATWTQRADTAFAEAGPTRLPVEWEGARVAARVVAYRRGDSTHFRHFVGLQQAPSDSTNEGARRIGLCGALGQAAQLHGTSPREPDGEEKLDLWTHRP